jgi:hypothetical protein
VAHTNLGKVGLDGPIRTRCPQDRLKMALRWAQQSTSWLRDKPKPCPKTPRDYTNTPKTIRDHPKKPLSRPLPRQLQAMRSFSKTADLRCVLITCVKNGRFVLTGKHLHEDISWSPLDLLNPSWAVAKTLALGCVLLISTKHGFLAETM